MSVPLQVKMANEIAAYFATEADHNVAVDGIVNHLKKYWDPRMRRQIAAHWQSGGAGLHPLALAAIERVAELDRFK